MTRLIIFIAIMISIIMIISCSEKSLDDTEKEFPFNGNYVQCDTCFFCEGSDSVPDCLNDFCINDTCKEYLNVWKDLFISINDLSEDYYNNHIFPCKTAMEKSDSEIQFFVFYKIIIDWVIVLESDQIVIWIDSTNNIWKDLNVPKNQLLAGEHIQKALNDTARGFRIQEVSPYTSLRFNSLKESLDTMIQMSGIDTLCYKRIFFGDKLENILTDGAPILHTWARKKMNIHDLLVYGYLDLVTGDSELDSIWVIAN